MAITGISDRGLMLFDQAFNKPKWRGADEFPSSDEWKREIDKWLQYIQRKGQLARYRPRLNDSKTRRDEALAEISSAYFLEEKLGHKVLRWEEKTVGDRDVDFVAKVNSQEVFCEVKSPGWEGELDPQERLGGRKALPKYINAEARFIGPWQSIRHAIAKSYPKFLDNQKNLVVMRDDLFVGPLDARGNLEIALLEEHGIYGGEKGYFADKRFERVGGFLALDARLLVAKGFEYRHQLVSNQFAKVPWALS